jgi:CRP/FNR family transcriptional regulator, anaerobic regulatory protein
MSIDTKAEPMGRFLEVFGSLFPSKEWPTVKRQSLLENLHFREMEPGTAILREGQVCSNVPFVLEGSIRVFKTAESGREITLYRIEKGQSCILSTGCGRGLSSFPATVVTDSATSAAFLPSETVRRLFAEGPAFRDFVLEQYSRRMAEVMELVEEIAFRRVDERLAQWIQEQSSAASTGLVVTTHQELADHVGSSREVVSRILKDWEQRKLLEISRGSLKLLPGFTLLRESLAS